MPQEEENNLPQQTVYMIVNADLNPRWNRNVF